MDDVELTFEEGAAEAIAVEALKRKTGARALRAIVEELMLDYMYDAPSNEDLKVISITKELVESRAKKNNEPPTSVLLMPDKKPKGEIA
jgi:ATP-dependent Clp protease ATP-binding subunit ClpX